MERRFYGLALLSLVLLLVGCSGPHMNRDEFAKVHLGMSASTIIDKVGRPDEIQDVDDGRTKDYVYIERRQVAPDYDEHIQYIFRIVNGHVVDKEVKRIEGYPDLKWD